MHSVARLLAATTWSCALMLAACSSQKQPAQQFIADIRTTVQAASAEAVKYIPERLADVESKLSDLQTSYDQRDYAAVLAAAPALLDSAQMLATAAAAKKDAVLKGLNDDWTNLAAVVPDQLSQVQGRIESLSNKARKKAGQGIDLAAAKSGAGDAAALWSKAEAAFAAGNLNEAVRSAKAVQDQLQSLAAALKLTFTPLPA